ncbi:SPOR domain-containing protein [uncultured Shewanella sp.]|uniref:SPOR domain-containing protein n=1 Tax=uncultured Shewanella sp. TaxID=173975 RepID=UPI002616A94B|nr:SPOR domain-containing protein [uncultured Shewanella sp.]
MRLLTWLGGGLAKQTKAAARYCSVLLSFCLFSHLVQANDDQTEYAKELQELKLQLEEWQRLRPAIERLISNEADLEFLILELSKLAEIKENPNKQSFNQYDNASTHDAKKSYISPPVNKAATQDFNAVVVGSELNSHYSESIKNESNLYAIHLASFTNKRNIKSSWIQYQNRFPGLLISGIPLTVSLVKNYKEYTRLIYGPYLSKKEAESSCKLIRVSKQYCSVVKYSGEKLKG